MNIDELDAFKTATIYARQQGWQWRPRYWISLEGDEWQVHSESEMIVRISARSGLPISDDVEQLDPLIAIRVAREYAMKTSLPWKPAFSLVLTADGWDVGSCQSQFGGQTHIYVDHHGEVTGHHFNPK